MSDFIREVDEGVRQDRVQRWLQRYWLVPIVLAILVLAGVGAWEGYDHLRTQRAETAGGQYLDALDLARDGKADEAVAALRAVGADGTPGYRLLARFRLAAEVGIKDKAAGAKLFDELGSDPTVEPALQNVARLRAGLLLLDTEDYAAIRMRLEPLADSNSPTRNVARELLALAALKAGATADAGRHLDAVETDPAASGQVRQRVNALQGLVRGAGSAPPAPSAPPAEATIPAASPPAPPPPEPAAPSAAAPAPEPSAAPATPTPPPPETPAK